MRCSVITEQEQRDAREYAAAELAAAGIVLGDDERGEIEVADFGLSRLASTRSAGDAALVPVRPDGAVVSEFSTASRDELDELTDPDVRRSTVVVD
jgi:hypothetical protein